MRPDLPRPWSRWSKHIHAYMYIRGFWKITKRQKHTGTTHWAPDWFVACRSSGLFEPSALWSSRCRGAEPKMQLQAASERKLSSGNSAWQSLTILIRYYRYIHIYIYIQYPVVISKYIQCTWICTKRSAIPWWKHPLSACSCQLLNLSQVVCTSYALRMHLVASFSSCWPWPKAKHHHGCNS